MDKIDRYSKKGITDSFLTDLRNELTDEIDAWDDSSRNRVSDDDFQKAVNHLLGKTQMFTISTTLVDSYKKTSEEKDKKIEALEKKLKSISSKETNIDLENAAITCGPYKIAPKKKTAFASVIWILKELNFFIKQEDGSYATNRSDVIDSLLTTKGNADQLLPKALKTDTFMNVFRDLLDKALEMYSKDEK